MANVGRFVALGCFLTALGCASDDAGPVLAPADSDGSDAQLPPVPTDAVPHDSGSLEAGGEVDAGAAAPQSVLVTPSETPQAVPVGDTDITLFVPPGAIQTPITITVAAVDPGAGEAATPADTSLFAHQALAAPLLTLEPTGTQFAVPIAVAMPVPIPAAYADVPSGLVRTYPLPSYSRSSDGAGWERDDLSSTAMPDDAMAFLALDTTGAAPTALAVFALDHFSQRSFVLPPLAADPVFAWGDLFTTHRLAMSDVTLVIPSANFSNSGFELATLESETLRGQLYYEQLRELMLQSTRQKAVLWGNFDYVVAAMSDRACPGCLSADRVRAARNKIEELRSLRDKLMKLPEFVGKIDDAINAEIEKEFDRMNVDFLKIENAVAAEESGAGVQRVKDLISCMSGGALDLMLYASMDRALVRARWEAFGSSIRGSSLYASDPAYRGAVDRLDLEIVGSGGSVSERFASASLAFLNGTLDSCQSMLESEIVDLVTKALVEAVAAKVGLVGGAGGAAFGVVAVELLKNYVNHDVIEVTANAQRLSTLGSMLALGGIVPDTGAASAVPLSVRASIPIVDVPATINAFDPTLTSWHRMQAWLYAVSAIADTTADIVAQKDSGYVGKGLSLFGDLGASFAGRYGARADVSASFKDKTEAYGAALDAIDRAMGACGILPCEFQCTDVDQDGYGEGTGCLGADCNDANPSAQEPETDAQYCQRVGWECETPAVADNCGVPRSVDCGSVSTEACGVCGTRTRQCSGGHWSVWSPCREGPSCTDGGTGTVDASVDAGTATGGGDAGPEVGGRSGVGGGATGTGGSPNGSGALGGSPSGGSATSDAGCGGGATGGTGTGDGAGGTASETGGDAASAGGAPGGTGGTVSETGGVGDAAGANGDSGGLGGSSGSGGPTFAGISVARSMSSTQVTLAWSSATDPATPSSNLVYDICHSTAPGVCATDFVAVETTTAGGTTWNVGKLPRNTQQYFLVRARNDLGTRDGNTVEVAATTAAADPRPSVATGNGGHACALLPDGTARCWGSNTYGQLGDGTNTNSTNPVSVQGLTNAVAIVAGTYHTCALLSDGTVRCWGYNYLGALGDGTTTNSRTPISVQGLTDAVAITGSQYSTCALLSDGTARCWGSNSYGQLGDATTTSRSTPVSVLNLATAVGITSGAFHACALLSDGTARCWGYNIYGQLGDGTTSNRSTPVSVLNLANAVGIAGVGLTTCTLISDGTARCWGNNSAGQLGDGTTTNRSSPVSVQGLTNAVAVASTCALISDGTARCWGPNNYGQVGDGTTTNRSSPVSVLGMANAVAMVGGSHVCALVSDGTARCWGSNSSGQLGDGTTTNRSTPATVSGLPTLFP